MIGFSRKTCFRGHSVKASADAPRRVPLPSTKAANLLDHGAIVPLALALIDAGLEQVGEPLRANGGANAARLNESDRGSTGHGGRLFNVRQGERGPVPMPATASA